MRKTAKFWIAAVLSLLIVTFSTHSFASVTIQVEQVVSELQWRTQLPIFLPSTVPSPFQIYANVGGDADSYSVYFDATPTCQGSTACNFGGIEGQRGGSLLTRLDIGSRDTLQSIQLSNGVQGQFANTCGSYCIAQVYWMYQGILYRTSIKNGTRSDVVAMANSAIQGGVRSVSASQSNEEFEGPFGGVVDHNWGLGASLAERGDFNSAQIRYQQALDAAMELEDPQLRDCAVSGSQARIASMEAARAYMRAHRRTPQSVQAAQSIASRAFRATLNTIHQERPDLVNSCP